MRIVLYQPDIPQNTGTILRLAACLGVDVDIIGPTGFDMTNRALKRAGLDYVDDLTITRHLDWEDFLSDFSNTDMPKPGRLILLTTKTHNSYLDFSFQRDDWLLLGRESAGVPAIVHESVNSSVSIPLKSGFRSLNIAVACAMVLGEALRQTDGFGE